MVTAHSGDVIALTLILIVIFILVFVYSALSRAARTGRNGRKPDGNREPAASAPKLPCPICGALLQKNERVKSYVYRAGTDCLSHIFGCPHCIPGTGGVRDRICPVCRKSIPPEGYLVARMFERTETQVRKTHVHVLGCTECRKIR